MRERRLIKRYANRRLYDFAVSRYITLAQVRALALKGTEFQALDARGKDITREVILLMVLEREKAGKPLISLERLKRLVRAGAGSGKGGR